MHEHCHCCGERTSSHYIPCCECCGEPTCRECLSEDNGDYTGRYNWCEWCTTPICSDLECDHEASEQLYVRGQRMPFCEAHAHQYKNDEEYRTKTEQFWDLEQEFWGEEVGE